jgi:hypothetical protein
MKSPGKALMKFASVKISAFPGFTVELYEV